VKTAWRKLAKENHPDIRPGDSNAAVRFQAVQAAYEVLRSAEERREWRPS
jgi:DnaJ-class molecular chaperone